MARIAGITVRTLHRYDEIGLFVPKGRTGAGYRLHDDDLLGLQQIGAAIWAVDAALAILDFSTSGTFATSPRKTSIAALPVGA